LSVRAVAQRSDALAVRARRLFRAALYEQCLNENTSSDAAVLRARCYARLGRYQEALDCVPAFAIDSLPAAMRVSALAVRAEMESRLGRDDEAGRLLDDADALASGRAARAEVAASRVAIAAAQRRYDQIAYHLPLAEASPDSSIRLRARLAAIVVSDAPAKNAAALHAVLAELGDSQEPDVYLQALALETLSALHRELALRESFDEVLGYYDAIDWSPHLRARHYAATRNLGWRCALKGDSIRAFALLHKAETLAADDAWRATSLLDRAQIAAGLWHVDSARADLLKARSLLDRLSFEDAGEERFALLTVVGLIAPSDTVVASSYLERYRALPPLPPRFLFAGDPRQRALEDYASGLLELALGRHPTASSELTSAYQTFERCGYAWRAGLAAAAMYRVTKESSWADVALRHLEPYHRSFLASAVASDMPLLQDPLIATLTQREREILAYSADGLSLKEIGGRLQLAVSTVNAHQASIRRKLHVASTKKAVAFAHEAGALR
jgi:DNA-binding CsgD family transcriptional regulator/tetratricopeptide (TPR) repeat protein